MLFDGIQDKKGCFFKNGWAQDRLFFLFLSNLEVVGGLHDLIVGNIFSFGSTAMQEESDGLVHVLANFDEDDDDETLGLSIDEQEEASCFFGNSDSGSTSRSGVGACFT